MKWSLFLLWLIYITSCLNNYVSVVFICDMSFKPYFFCWFTALLFCDAKRGNQLGLFRVLRVIILNNI